MAATVPTAGLVHRTAHIRLRATRHQTDRCYQLLRAAGDLWAWLLDDNRARRQHGQPPLANYQQLCRQLTSHSSFGELSIVGARSVLRRYADAWHQAAKRRRQGQQRARFPRRKRALIPVRFYHGTFQLDGRRVRLPVAKGRPVLWVRLARPIPYPAEQVRAVTLLAEGGRLWLAVTAAVPVQQHDLDPGRVAGVDLGIIHPYAVVTEQAGLLVSGRRCGPRAGCTCTTSKHGRPRRPGGHPGQGSAARAAGAATAPSYGGWRRGIVAASTKLSMRRPSR
jgi:transposase